MQTYLCSNCGLERPFFWLPVLYRPVEHSRRENETRRWRHPELPNSTVKIFTNEGIRNCLLFELSGQALVSVSSVRAVQEYGKQKFCTGNKALTFYLNAVFLMALPLYWAAHCKTGKALLVFEGENQHTTAESCSRV